MYPQDMLLAATRFATSKLVHFDDLKTIQTFGFRGEALASASMVGRLSIVSRRREKSTLDFHSAEEVEDRENQIGPKYSTSCAYKLSYVDGKPTDKKPSPTAGKEGTTVKLQDLFYNVPSRRRAFEGSRKEKEEYNRLLVVAQRYSIRSAGEGVGFICRKKGGHSDLNTASLLSVKKANDFLRKEKVSGNVTQGNTNNVIIDARSMATKDAIGHVYGSYLVRELLTLNCEEGSVSEVSLSALKLIKENERIAAGNTRKDGVFTESEKEKGNQVGNVEYGNIDDTLGDQMAIESSSKQEDNGAYSFAYRAIGYLTNGSYCAPKSSSAFILFINGRLVESASLRRAIEGVYMDSLPRGAKPFVFLDLSVPGPHVDVNVHPTKREIAFLHEEKLCAALANATKELLFSAKTSRTFYAQTLLPLCKPEVESKLNKGDSVGKVLGDEFVSIESESKKLPSEHDKTESNAERKRSQQSSSPTTPNKKRSYDPKNLMRINSAAHQGALEPYLVPASYQQNNQKTQSKNEKDDNCEEIEKSAHDLFRHDTDCEFYGKPVKELDLTKPGAFASICRCQIKQSDKLPPLSGNYHSSSVTRLKKVIATSCSLESIRLLRSNITSQAHGELTSKLRECIFVGCISRQRSLVQWGIELLMINHFDLAKQLFYQLALARFGGALKANLGANGVNVKEVIEHFLKVRESLDLNAHNNEKAISKEKDNTDSQAAMARQATKLLYDHRNMLDEYFSIDLKLEDNQVVLKSMPILLDGHSPAPHAIPLFLLRLVTEVNWNDELECFQGICTELGNYYAEIPFTLDDKENTNQDKEDIEDFLVSDKEKKIVQHTIFPALAFLLVLPKKFASNGYVVRLALLSKLYKVFERC
eukprot:CAMPEP_0184857214 /NCGR_PEP_ID=MMETSP0580-20130426/2371_1 /TAXON_ID=1118495 /ORGANISM="Dactyliosolen fragilissimus" /LENGTH=871 /DNA_ID=CAMNT_0027352679 /DNA_START=548 /DNA_END=3163 /DNA_ORIENTATION=+